MENKKNVFKIELIDNTNKTLRDGETIILEKRWIGNDVTDEILSIARYHDYCRQFAYAMGYTEETINKYFGLDHLDELM